MGAINALQYLVGAGQNPTSDFNPYYGAQLLTPNDPDAASHGVKTPTWIDANGQPITDPTHIAALTAQPQLASTPYTPGGFWHGLGSVGMEEKQANANALQYPGQQAQELAAKQRGIIGESAAVPRRECC
jgi:hypothetical protein